MNGTRDVVVHEFPCPHCSTPLRLRDASFAGRVVDCPDCRRPVLIEDTPQGLVGLADLNRRLPAQRAPAAHVNGWSRRAGLATAGLLSLALGAALWRGDGAGLDHSPPTISPGDAALPVPAWADDEEHAFVEPQDPPPDDAAPDAEPPAAGPRERLLEIHRLLAPAVLREEAFPRGRSVPAGDATSFSWVAELALRALPPAPTHRQRSWDDPANDAFIRRRFPAFTNPLLADRLGDDGYPASHFVGVAGVGADAAELDAAHPRAGIFASNRRTRVADVQDGLSNTLLIAGVRSRLGSWARPGEATFRSFQREPYIDGPDGFGTGEAGGMSVLMADGSVRFLSGDVDPVLVRRMAAMADGLPLDPLVAGDPLTMDLPLPDDAAAHAPAAEPKLPVEDALPEAPPVDVAARLAVEIARFELTQPARVESVLADLAELAGVPVDLSRLTEAQRGTRVTASVRESTLAEVLEAVLQGAALRSRIAGDGIVIEPVVEE